MKNILLLTDFSENALNSINYSLELFKDSDCKFWLLHVKKSSDYISSDLLSMGKSSIYDSLFAKIEDQLTDLIRTLQKKSGDRELNIEPLVAYNDLTEAVNHIGQSKQIDMIVMGSNGLTGAREVVFGSHTINMANHAKIPTLVVPENYEYNKLKTCCLPLNATDPLEGQIMEAFVAFADNFNLKVHVLRVGKVDQQSTETLDIQKLNKYSANLNYTYEYIKDKPLFEAMDSYLKSEKTNVIALFLHKESFFHRLFKTSTTDKIAKNLKIPMMMFHY